MAIETLNAVFPRRRLTVPQTPSQIGEQVALSGNRMRSEHPFVLRKVAIMPFLT